MPPPSLQPSAVSLHLSIIPRRGPHKSAAPAASPSLCSSLSHSLSSSSPPPPPPPAPRKPMSCHVVAPVLTLSREITLPRGPSCFPAKRAAEPVRLAQPEGGAFENRRQNGNRRFKQGQFRFSEGKLTVETHGYTQRGSTGSRDDVRRASPPKRPTAMRHGV